MSSDSDNKKERPDLSKVDEAQRPVEDRPPGYADVLMAEHVPIPAKEPGEGSAADEPPR